MCLICLARAQAVFQNAEVGFVPAEAAESALLAAEGAGSGVVAVFQPPTGIAAIDGLLMGAKWGGLGLTFSFPRSGGDLPVGYGSESYTVGGVLNQSLQGAVWSALTQGFGVAAPLGFSLVAPNAPASIRFGLSTQTPTAYAYFPGTATRSGDVWFGTSSFGGATEALRGGYQWTSVLHEAGHALGLKHPHEASNGFPRAPAERNSLEFTVMSYASYVGFVGTQYVNEYGSFPSSLMQDDIRAIQALYGANYGVYAGATTYQWEPTTGEMYLNGVAQGRPVVNRVFQTIWDGGGDDTYDLSNYDVGLLLDLTPGGWSRLAPDQLARLGNGQVARGSVANALQVGADTRSLIENAVGGAGDDRIVGNAAANRLTGNGGNDVLFGGEGPDSLAGNAGDDALFGASGRDTAWYFTINAADASWSRRADGWVTLRAGAEGTDYLLSVEQLRFADRLVSLTPPLPRDLDGDGRSDLLLFRPNDGSFATRLVGANPVALTAPSPSARVAATGDFDGNGTADLLWRSSTTLLATLPNGAALGPAIGAPGANWAVAGTGDFNGDGRSDLLWREDGGGIVLWFMNGGTVSGGGLIGNPGANWNVAGIGDLNCDGRSDILWRNTEGTVWTWLLDGLGIVGNGGQGSPGANWAIRGVGDLDGDGHADVVWQNTDGLVYGWLMDGAVATRYGAIGNPGPSYDVRVVADTTADDRADLLFQGPGGQLYGWFMAGLTVASHRGFNSVPDGWELA